MGGGGGGGDTWLGSVGEIHLADTGAVQKEAEEVCKRNHTTTHTYTRTPIYGGVHLCDGQRTAYGTWFSTSIMWVLEIKIRLQALAASTFPQCAILPDQFMFCLFVMRTCSLSLERKFRG